MSLTNEESTSRVRHSRANAINEQNMKNKQKPTSTTAQAQEVPPVQPLTKGGYRVAIGKAPDRGNLAGALNQAAETLSKVTRAPSEGITPLPPLNRDGVFPIAETGLCKELGIRVSREDLQRVLLKDQEKAALTPA